jgi:hypothetical protein
MKRRRRQLMLRRAILVLAALLILTLIFASVMFVAKLVSPETKPGNKANPVVEKYSMEAGTKLLATDLLKDSQKGNAEFVTDVDALNLNIPGLHRIEIKVDGKNYFTTVTVADTIAPTAEPADAITKPGVVPDAEKLVKNIKDAGPVTVTYKQKPDVSVNDKTVTAIVLLTDAGGNTATVKVPVLVFLDEIAPVISGAVNRVYYIGDSVAYKEGVTVTDDQTKNPVLTVDNKAVRPQTPGSYPVIYKAKDASGNETSVTVYFTFRERPSGYVEPEVVYEYARDILKNKIKVTDKMTKPQVAAAIYNWVKQNIRWNDHSNKDHGWAAGAKDGFEQRQGDCFTYYSVTKALLDVAGIPNLDVVKVVTPETSQSAHYWSLVDVGDGWYHMDCTPRANAYEDSFFLYTDAEMLAYSQKPENKNCFNFDPDAYPPRASESVQKYIKFSVPTVTIKESW